MAVKRWLVGWLVGWWCKSCRSSSCSFPACVVYVIEVNMCAVTYEAQIVRLWCKSFRSSSCSFPACVVYVIEVYMCTVTYEAQIGPSISQFFYLQCIISLIKCAFLDDLHVTSVGHWCHVRLWAILCISRLTATSSAEWSCCKPPSSLVCG